MKRTRPLRRRQAARGIAAIEFGILLPIFIFLTLPVIDFARAIQANLILVSLTREGANLASRSSTYTPQDIMVALAVVLQPESKLSDAFVASYLSSVGLATLLSLSAVLLSIKQVREVVRAASRGHAAVVDF